MELQKLIGALAANEHAARRLALTNKVIEDRVGMFNLQTEVRMTGPNNPLLEIYWVLNGTPIITGKSFARRCNDDLNKITRTMMGHRPRNGLC